MLSYTKALLPQRHSRTSIKAGPVSCTLTHSSRGLLPCDQQGTLHTTDMSCYNICRPCGPTPLANSCNEPCVRQCEDSHVAIQPSTVLVTLPGPILSSFPQNTAVGPILSSFPQNTAVGSSASAAVGSNLSAQGVPVSGGGFGGFGLGGFGFGGLGCFSGRRACYPC
uniref:Keratin n=1 Tax=Anas platyrhynchos platyrhynchos TaxID=8840 RepID=A0A493T2P8_ANAPP